MANVYIEEFPIDKNVISKEYISSIVYVNNKYYVIQYNKLYELDIVTGHFNYIKDLSNKSVSNAVVYNNKIYYTSDLSNTSQRKLVSIDASTYEENYKIIPCESGNSGTYFDKTKYNNISFETLSLQNGKIIFTAFGGYYSGGSLDYFKYELSEYNLELGIYTNVKTGTLSKYSWKTISPTKYINNPSFDYGSVSGVILVSGNSSELKNYFGGYKHTINDIVTYNKSERGVLPYLSYHTTLEEYDGTYMINGGYFGAESGGIYYFKEY